jgi:hypothetical protein
MRKLTAAAALFFTAVTTQVQAATPASAAAAAHYSVSTTEIGTLIDDPAAKAVLDKHIPGMTTSDQIDMARGMTLKDIQQYSPDQITDTVLTAVEADLAKLPAKPAK